MKTSELKLHIYIFITTLALFLLIALTICNLPKLNDNQSEQPAQKISHINDYLQKLQIIVDKIGQIYKYNFNKSTLQSISSVRRLNPFLIGEDGRVNENNLRRMNDIILKLYKEAKIDSNKIRTPQLSEEFNEYEKILAALATILGDLENTS